ncbi:hypothetical protein [Hydrogenophaga soli]|nr:hypothetical protein [Burkholderiaceae bacterium]
MIKIIIGFILFAALAMFILIKGGGDIDMSGEKHGIEEAHPPAAAAAPATPAAPAPAAAPAAAPTEEKKP